MYVRTLPREIAARWIKSGDEVAMYEAENGHGDTDSGIRRFARAETFVNAHPGAVDWFLVLDGSVLVAPPADEAAGRVEGTVKHQLGGRFTVEREERDFVPDGVDHVGSHRLVMVPIQENTIGSPVVVFARDEEQFVIRERVKVDGMEYADNVVASLKSDQRNAAALHVLELAHDEEVRGSAGVDTRAPGEVTVQLPSRRVPLGVMGAPLGRMIQESDAVDFHSARDSDEEEQAQ